MKRQPRQIGRELVAGFFGKCVALLELTVRKNIAKLRVEVRKDFVANRVA